MMEQTPIYQLYAGIAPQPVNWPVIVGKVGDLLRQDYDWSGEVSTLKTPTLLVVGDADSVRTSHALKFFELLGGGRRDGGYDGSGMSSASLPSATHYSIFTRPELASTVTPSLNGRAPRGQ